jgi:thymidylate synthase
LYSNHIKQAQEFLTRKNRKLPTLQLNNGINMTNFNELYIPNMTEIKLNNYNPYPAIKAELSVGK